MHSGRRFGVASAPSIARQFTVRQATASKRLRPGQRGRRRRTYNGFRHSLVKVNVDSATRLASGNVEFDANHEAPQNPLLGKCPICAQKRGVKENF